MKMVILIVVSMLLSNTVQADSIRCGRKIIKQGDSGSMLIRKCGNPVRKFSSKETINDQGRQTKVSVSNWVYERGGKKNMIVSIRSGMVVKIQLE